MYGQYKLGKYSKKEKGISSNIAYSVCTRNNEQKFWYDLNHRTPNIGQWGTFSLLTLWGSHNDLLGKTRLSGEKDRGKLAKEVRGEDFNLRKHIRTENASEPKNKLFPAASASDKGIELKFPLLALHVCPPPSNFLLKPLQNVFSIEYPTESSQKPGTTYCKMFL
jgi:hypothetical protein